MFLYDNLLNSITIIIIISVINFIIYKNVIVLLSNAYIFVIFYIKTIHIDYISKETNLLNFSFNKLALLWSNTENTFLMYILGANLFIIFIGKLLLNKSIYNVYIKNINTLFKIIIIALLLTFNIYEYSVQNNFSYLTFNTILDNTYLIFHPPIILFSILIIKYQIFIELTGNKNLQKNNNPNKIYIFIYFILIIGIITGSLWSSYLFGWGGWWIWDPIENISITYLFLIILLIHLNKNTISKYLILKIIIFYDYFFFFLFKLNYVSSLHIFKSNIFYIKYNLFIYIIIFFLLFFFIIFNKKNKYNKKYIINNLFVYNIALILLSFFLQNFNFLYELNVNYSIINIFLNYIVFLFLAEIIILSSHNYININIYINLFFLVITIVLFKNFLLLIYSIYILFFFKTKKYTFFFYIHYSILIILLLILYYPIYELNIYINLLQTLIEKSKIIFFFVNSLLTEHIFITKSNKLINFSFIDGMLIYNKDSLNINYSNNSIQLANNNTKNEFFLLWGNWYSKLMQIIFISFKIQNIITYFIVYLSVILLVLNFLIYKKIYKKNKKFFYSFYIY